MIFNMIDGSFGGSSRDKNVSYYDYAVKSKTYLTHFGLLIIRLKCIKMAIAQLILILKYMITISQMM